MNKKRNKNVLSCLVLRWICALCFPSPSNIKEKQTRATQYGKTQAAASLLMKRRPRWFVDT